MLLFNKKKGKNKEQYNKIITKALNSSNSNINIEQGYINVFIERKHYRFLQRTKERLK